MLSKRLVLIVVVCAVGVGRPAASAEPTTAAPATVALTMTKPADATKDQQLAENLLTLVELDIQSDKSLALVERRQIDLAVQELILDRSRPDKAQLELGKLLTADFVAMLEMLPPDKDSPNPWARLRVVDPKTAAIRGVTVASLDEATLEETAQQFSRYVSALIRAPQMPTVTVAVVPFESKGRFDRLRPLELGIRDLVTARLLELGGAASPHPAAAEDGNPVTEAPRFQVLQRTKMEQLLRELDLIRSGLSDKSRLPDTLPSRAGVYLIRGEIDERQADDQYKVIVRGEMIEAAAQSVVEKFEFECLPAELEIQLADQVDRIAQRLLAGASPPAHIAGNFEVRSLKQLVMADLSRCQRLLATTHEVRPFQAGKLWKLGSAANAVHVDTTFGRNLFKKSIDRLESILFITPDDAEAAYSLAFCYSMHENDLYRPDRADELCRKAFLLDPESPGAASALALLAEIAYDDRTGKLDAGSEAVTIERLWFAFEHTPPKYRDHHWAQLLKKMGELQTQSNQCAALADLLGKAAPYAEKTDPSERYRLSLIYFVRHLAIQLVHQSRDQPSLKATGMELLKRWAESTDSQLADFGSQGLATVLVQQNDLLGAAAVCEESAAKMAPQSRLEQQRHDQRLIDAAQYYRLAGQPKRALELLLSFETRLVVSEIEYSRDNPASPGTNLLGTQGFEIGACYEALGETEKALAAYLLAVERCPLIAANSEFLRRLDALGGVPLRKDRDVDVRYFTSGTRQHTDETCLASDGRQIYVGGKEGLRAFDIANETWETTKFPPAWVTNLKSSDGGIWAGTHADGLWRRDSSSGEWMPVAAGQLPDQHIETLVTAGRDVYLGVGTQASGGLVRIDGEGKVHVFNESDAPAAAPTDIIVNDRVILARTSQAIHEWSFESKQWSLLQIRGQRPRLFAGKTAIWASKLGQELTRWQASAKDNELFKPAWYIPANNTGYVLPAGKAGYAVRFAAEHGDDVWFGGDPSIPFLTSGLCRLNLKTGAFHKFGPADGFKECWFHRVYDALWIDDQLWLATSEGLCVVTERK